MTVEHTLAALLAAEQDPPRKSYNSAVESAVNDPRQIRRLIEGDAKEDTLAQLTTRGPRLAGFFICLHHRLRENAGSATVFRLATETAAFLTSILPDLDQLLPPENKIEIIVPALEVCFASSQSLPLRELALALAQCDILLEHLASDRSGSTIVRQWVHLPSNLTFDAATQEVWTGRLVSMVSSCPGYHDVAHSVHQWATLIPLKRELQSLEARLLDEEAKMISLPRGQTFKRAFLPLDDNTKEMLKILELTEPESRRMVQSHLEVLRSTKIPAILRSIATSFPCKRCIPALGSTPRSTNAEIRDHSNAVTLDLSLDVLGKPLGVWKVLLSRPALKNIQKLGRLGLFLPVRAKLIDLASGSWKCNLAGSANQRERLKVPLAKTKCEQSKCEQCKCEQSKCEQSKCEQSKCEQSIFILWQVGVSFAGDAGLPQQTVLVWEVGDLEATSKAVDRVSHLQEAYKDEDILRCRQDPPILNEKRIPAHLKYLGLPSTISEQPSAEFDVRTVDQDTIDLASKFYALTEPIIQSILDKRLNPEFPFDLSMEEVQVFSHFQTASLILGRSGTGKTTCLVFKLVGKFLASKAILDEKPVRQVSFMTIAVLCLIANEAQVLLTRSSFLADKLASYTQRLIQTLSSTTDSSGSFEGEEDRESHNLESFEAESYSRSRTTEEDSDDTSVFALRDQNFPLICTFENFLQMLERTITKLDRQDFSDRKELTRHGPHKASSIQRTIERQTVHFYTFKVDYWPRFPKNLVKDTSVNLVFAEIMGVIKGSVSSRESLAPISREEYLTRSCRLAPTFASDAERSYVYDIFELYEKMKIERGDVDYIDRVVRIIRAVRGNWSLLQLLRSTFDEIYIDEIQDHRCLDIELFLCFLKDARGFHLAGDTAQAISHDSTFRFADIKLLFYEHFAETSTSTQQNDLAKPQMFTLSKNYRSHQGILALASMVMEMIWKGFPDTIDKLNPEVGNLSGPKPVLFLECGVDILLSRKITSSENSEHANDFGADQVILVRDTRSKITLQNQMGDAALILTILESKGMEFEDVILWNFFSDCPDPAGVRSLNALKTNMDDFDPRKHGGMCSELKHLYVAITRARSQLSIIESSHTIAVPVLQLLTQGSPKPLVDKTWPNHESFDLRVEMLRPKVSVDPTAWIERADEFMRRCMYKEALMAFRRAGDTEGEMEAQGFLKEEEGKLCKDNDGFTRNMRLAIESFLKVNLVGDAVRILELLEEFEEAAELCFMYKNYNEAAPLFAEAGLYTKAAVCHHRLQHYNKAADSLRRGNNYDQLVSYVNKHNERISPNDLRGYSLLCKLLLKQRKVSPEHRKHAISLLGSLNEQEACFLEYGMDEQLAELYTDQERHKDLYDLFSRTGQLEKALNLGLSEGLVRSTTNIPESELLKLLDYVWANKIVTKGQHSMTAAFMLRPNYLTPRIRYRIEQWEANYRMYGKKCSNTYSDLLKTKETVVSKVMTLQMIIDKVTLNQVSKLDELPFELMQQAVGIVKDLVLKEDTQVQSVLFVLTGIWTLGPQKSCVLLPWSPFYESLTDLTVTNLSRVAKKWIVDKIASTILTVDTKARMLWSAKWRARCVYHLATGVCKQRNCQKSHEQISQDDCSRILEGLFRVNSLFCDLAPLYYRRIMSTAFQKTYLGIRRHWLERLLRELTFLSSTEQSASVITKTQTELLRSNKFLVLRSSLEELLYFRLGKDWRHRSDFTALLEQMQIAEAFGPNVRRGLFQAVSHRLLLDHRDPMQRHLSLLNWLRLNPDCQTSSIFLSNLQAFLHDLDNHNARTFATLHAFTAVCESLATYLITKTCVAACVLTQSYIDLYRPSISMAASSSGLLEWPDRHRYQQCLIELAKAFCRVLKRVKEYPSNSKHFCSGTTHEAFPLQKRNAELVAIMIANMAAMSEISADVWTSAEVVFPSDTVLAIRRRIAAPGPKLTPGELLAKLAPQFLKKNNKDALVVVAKVLKKGLVFSNLDSYPGVNTVLFDHLSPQSTAASDENVSSEPLPSTIKDNPQGEYSKLERDAVAKIQRLWRSCSAKIKRRRLYIPLPEHRAIARLFNLSTHCPATTTLGDRKAIQKLLVLRGVSLSLRLLASQEVLSSLQTDSMAFIENVEVSVGVFESIDTALGRNREAEALLSEAEREMSDERLNELVKSGLLHNVEDSMGKAEAVLVKAEGCLKESRKIVDAMSSN